MLFFSELGGLGIVCVVILVHKVISFNVSVIFLNRALSVGILIAIAKESVFLTLLVFKKLNSLVMRNFLYR